MQINLRKAVNQGPQHLSLTLTERLPYYIEPPVHLECGYAVERKDNYYLVNLNVRGDLTITCQRCLKPFAHAYANHLELAVCGSEEAAEKLLTTYEAIVALDNQIDLEGLITDELHLYSPQSHEDPNECDPEIAAYIHAERQ
ncbi:metal-binding protein [Legionella rubrilucens]|uniref:Large ribosomal RNA subunit accumulation protein YceD n=1 Tax=Legionella rubrilucens TaxID=458 RepID=A0A0W0XYM6_9GAMM|nr:YceD family protein [Legionella rubrilucens]KTD49358.1 metal-binding protein [Legionella rubrilucens]